MKLKYRIISVLALVVILLFSSPYSLSALSVDEIIEQQKAFYDWDSIKDIVPERAYEASDDFGQKLSIENIETFLSPKGVLTFVAKEFLQGIVSNMDMLVSLIGILIIALFIKFLSDAYPATSIIKVINAALILSSALILFGGIFNSIADVTKTFENISSFTVSFIPITVALMSASGNPSFAGVSSATVFMAVQFFGSILSSFIVPCINTYLTMGIGAGLSGNSSLRKISDFIKNWSVIIISFIYCIFIGTLSLQSFLSMTKDNLTKRSLKFAAGSFIPIAGSFIGEGLETVYACANGLKNTAGVFGIIVILLIAAAPILNILSKYIILKIAIGICGFFENDTLSSFLSIAKDVFAIFFSILAGYTIMIILLLTIMIKAGG